MSSSGTSSGKGSAWPTPASSIASTARRVIERGIGIFPPGRLDRGQDLSKRLIRRALYSSPFHAQARQQGSTLSHSKPVSTRGK